MDGVDFLLKQRIHRRDVLKLGALGAGSLVWPGMAGFAHSARETEQKEIITTCNICNLGCSVLAAPEADEKKVSLRGNPDSPTNRGKLCAKGQAGFYKTIHPERLGYPLIRVGRRGAGRWKRLSWEEALNRISRGLLAIKQEHGARSIALWQNVNMDRADIFKRFIFALGSPNYIAHTSVCDSSLHIGRALVMGPTVTLADYKNTKTILLVGVNPFGAKNLVYDTRRIMDARTRGAKLIVVDPRLSETAAHANPGFWAPIRPGTDGIFLAGLANYLIKNNLYDRDYVKKYTFGFAQLRSYLRKFTIARVCDKTDISREQFLRIADALAQKPALVDINRGGVTHIDGTDTARMACILNVLLGSLDRPGGLIPLNWPLFELADAGGKIELPAGERIDGAGENSTPLPVGARQEYSLSLLGLSHHLPRNILNEDPYALKALIFSSINPVYSLPQGQDLIKAFDKLELIVSIDAFMSETASYADIVLPGATYLESRELWHSRGVLMSLRQPVIKPLMESRPAQDIIIQLAHRMGLEREFPFPDYEVFIKEQLKGTPVDYNTLKTKGFVEFTPRPGERLKKGFKTPSGRLELLTSLAFGGANPLPRFARFEGEGPLEKNRKKFPFYLITYKLPFHTQSATGENPFLGAILKENPVYLSPATAKKLGVDNGDMLELTSVRGSLVARVYLTQGIHPDCLALSHHFGHRAYSKLCAGKGVSAAGLLSEGTDPAGGNLTFNDTRVNARKWERAR